MAFKKKGLALYKTHQRQFAAVAYVNIEGQ